MHSILIVEDDAEQLDVLSETLEFAGYKTSRAHNGREALDMLRIPPGPALVLLDLNLPIMNGRQFLDRKRNDPGLIRVPVLAMSARTTERPQGTVGCLRKPISVPALLNAVTALC